jgi:hypothetical protein
LRKAGPADRAGPTHWSRPPPSARHAGEVRSRSLLCAAERPDGARRPQLVSGSGPRTSQPPRSRRVANRPARPALALAR